MLSRAAVLKRICDRRRAQNAFKVQCQSFAGMITQDSERSYFRMRFMQIVPSLHVVSDLLDIARHLAHRQIQPSCRNSAELLL